MSALDDRRHRQRSLAGIVAALVLMVGVLLVQPFAGATEDEADEPAAASGVAAAPPIDGRAFTDVGPSHPFVTEIGWLVAEGIANGFPDGSFRPTDAVSRQATAAFLYRFDGIAPRTVPAPPACTEPAFTDVGVAHPFCGEIAWLVAEGIAGGFPDGSFRPTDAVSRQAAAAFIHRFAGEPEPPSIDEASFTDVPLDHPFSDAIEWAVDVGITTGFPDDTFKPTDAVSRQAMAAFLYRYLTEYAGVDPTPTTTTTADPTTTTADPTTTVTLPSTTITLPTTTFTLPTTTFTLPSTTTTTLPTLPTTTLPTLPTTTLTLPTTTLTLPPPTLTLPPPTICPFPPC